VPLALTLPPRSKADSSNCAAGTSGGSFKHPDPRRRRARAPSRSRGASSSGDLCWFLRACCKCSRPGSSFVAPSARASMASLPAWLPARGVRGCLRQIRRTPCHCSAHDPSHLALAPDAASRRHQSRRIRVTIRRAFALLSFLISPRWPLQWTFPHGLCRLRRVFCVGALASALAGAFGLVLWPSRVDLSRSWCRRRAPLLAFAELLVDRLCGTFHRLRQGKLAEEVPRTIGVPVTPTVLPTAMSSSIFYVLCPCRTKRQLPLCRSLACIGPSSFVPSGASWLWKARIAGTCRCLGAAECV
jgi:hypothetical protein